MPTVGRLQQTGQFVLLVTLLQQQEGREGMAGTQRTKSTRPWAMAPSTCPAVLHQQRALLLQLLLIQQQQQRMQQR
jgi:hypothetical protein